jgi:hypothetical protein
VGLEKEGRCTQVGSDEHPLRERVGVQVIIEHREVLDFGQAIRLGGYGFVADERTVSLKSVTRSITAFSIKDEHPLVLPDIIIGSSLLIDIVPFES